MGFQLVSTVGSLDEGIAGRGGCCSCFSMLGWPWWMLQLLQYAWVAMVAFRMRLLINVIGFLILWDITWLLGAGDTGGCVKSDVVGVFDTGCSYRILKHQCMILEYTEQCGV
uniref:Uncharacterized protein n=1 Tax=Populus trichocarpa TaxID=3694 RepID=B9NHI5_POPTR